eukprot:15020016-Heterocapsa_arctica.AAC.1
MGGHWACNPVPRPILPHPNTWTLLGILELHSSPLECEATTRPVPLQWKDDQGNIWHRQNNLPNNNVDPRPDLNLIK